MAVANLDESVARIQEQTGGEANDGAVGSFYREKEYSEILSAAKGEPVYLETDYCRIRVAGNRGEDQISRVQVTMPNGEVRISDEYNINRFPRAWDAFMRGEDLRPDGTLLEDCPAIPRERIAGLKKASVRTIEDLIGLPDRSLQRIGPDGRALQRAAQEFIKEHDAGEQALEELKALRAELAALKGAKDDGDNTSSGASNSRRAGSKKPG